jgi:VWFA-related protein
MSLRLFLAALVAGTSATLLAQSTPPAQPDQPRPTFRAEANYVRVDMYATADGQPVEDLKEEEIEILEDGVPQKIATFEHVIVRPAGPQQSRIEPNTVAESRQLAQDPRARVFVIFLDTYHVQVEGSHAMRVPVARFLDRVIGQDDLVAVMTPEMSPSELAFGRKTTVISNMMQEDWAWGRREAIAMEDAKERRYQACYGRKVMPGTNMTYADEMIDRRREELTLEALEDLVTHLRGLREERKAVLTVSEGWRLFGRSPTLAASIRNERGRRDPDGREPIYVGPDGKLRRGPDPREEAAGAVPATMAECDADRLRLAELEHPLRFHRLFEAANRANVSFYPVYPRGLAVFDSPIGPRRPPPVAVDARNLSARHNSLRELAENTDGLAVVNTNAIESAMERIVSDLTSYYLLGYYSTNTKLDGKFRTISVRVKRPGVQVRARRGYRGTTAEELTSAEAAAKARTPTAVSKAFNAVAAVSPRSQLRVRSSTWTTPAAGDRPAAAVWLVGELDYRTRKDLAWSAGAVADVAFVSAAGEEIAAKRLDLASTASTFTLRLPDTGGVPPGEYALRVRVRPNQEGGLPVSDTVRVIVPEQPSRVGDAIIWRRGPTTGPRYMATADPRFQRSERVRLEHATTAAGMPTARMLDKAGNPLQVPVQVTERPDASGEFRWLIAEAALAPLAPGDYAIELTLDDAKVVTAFKVVP